MPRSPQDPIEVVVRNLFAIQRAGSSLNDGVQARVHALFDEIAALIAKIDPTAPALQRYRIQRAETLFAEIRSLTGETFDEITKQVRVQLAGLGQAQADAATLHLRAMLGTEAGGEVEAVKVTLSQMRAIVDSEPMQGALLKDWFKKQGTDTAFRVQRQIQLGMTNAEGVGPLVDRVRKLVRPTSQREAEAIVRTAVNHISTAAAERSFRANADIIDKVEWVATLDARTCPTCGPLDGKTWALDDATRPKPPLHMGDRCILVAVPDWNGLGLEPPPSGTRATKLDPATGKPGQVSSDVHYEDWLRAQSAAVQDEIMGPGRAKVFRDGKVTLAQMVRSDGTRVPLESLTASARPATSGLVRAEAKRAHELTFEGLDPGAPGQFETKMERLVSEGRRGVRSRLVGAEGMDALADELGFDPTRHLLRGQDPAEGRAAYVASTLTQHWDFLGPKDRPWFNAMHLAAKDEFGIDGAWTVHLEKGAAAKKAAEIYGKHGAALRAYVRAQYEETQAYLKAHGVEHLTLFRGITVIDPPPSRAGERIQWADQPMSSYTYNAQIAGRFAVGNGDGKLKHRPERSYMAAVRVPADRVFSLSRTGPGKWNEGEFVLLGGAMEGVAVDMTAEQSFLLSHAFDDGAEIIRWWWSLLESGGFLAP